MSAKLQPFGRSFLIVKGESAMRVNRLFFLVCAASVLLVPAALAQEPPKPGPEHARLKKAEGTWDATVKFGDQESKGIMTYKMDLGGLWMTSDFKGEFAGQKFEGKGLDTYDAGKKKYINVWVDSMSTSPMIMEGAYDKDNKVLTLTGEGPGMDGKMVKYKGVLENKDNDTMVYTMSNPGKDGKDQVMMTITYKRKK
jgi:Protein of unknown function (DUF1579)